MGGTKREIIARRAAIELKNGMVVNLGIGIPTLVADFLPDDSHVFFHAENGIFGYGSTPKSGEEDPNLCNAGGLPITISTAASYFDSCMAFAIIRRGLLDVTILGALQVSQLGDLANWTAPGRIAAGVGGAVELAQKTSHVIVVTEHVTKDGQPKIVRECTYPLTAKNAVDLIITDMAVMSVEKDGLHLLEIAKGHDLEKVLALTDANVILNNPLGVYS